MKDMIKLLYGAVVITATFPLGLSNGDVPFVFSWLRGMRFVFPQPL